MDADVDDGVVELRRDQTQPVGGENAGRQERDFREECRRHEFVVVESSRDGAAGATATVAPRATEGAGSDEPNDAAHERATASLDTADEDHQRRLERGLKIKKLMKN